MMKELTFNDEAEAHTVRRGLINRGHEVSLVAYDSDRGKYVFDTEPPCQHGDYGLHRIERFTDPDGNKHEARWCGGCGDTIYDDIIKEA